jgi:hypothetical protein
MAKKTHKRKRGGMHLPSDAALRVSMPESSDNVMALSGGKRRKRNGRTYKRKH